MTTPKRPKATAKGRGRPGNRNAAGPHYRNRPDDRRRWLADLRDRPRGRTHGAATAAREVPLVSAVAVGGPGAAPPLRELTSPTLEPEPGDVFRDLVADLISARGGIETVTPQERLLIEAAAHAALQLAYVDAWIARQPTFIKPNAVVLPIIETRARIARSLVSTLKVLGLDRKAKDVGTLRDYLAGRDAAADGPASPDAEAPQ